MTERNLRLMHLAQEHQAARKFTQAIREVATEDAADLTAIAERIRRVFASDLEPHFQEEEKHVLPMLRAGGYAALADEIFAQHETMRGMEKAFAALTPESLTDFVRTLEKHIVLEEGEVWDILDDLLAQKKQAPAAE